jgi:hypothetical protein
LAVVEERSTDCSQAAPPFRLASIGKHSSERRRTTSADRCEDRRQCRAPPNTGGHNGQIPPMQIPPIGKIQPIDPGRFRQ